MSMNVERVGSLFWLALGLISIYGAYHLGLGTLREPGSGFLPFLAGCFVGLVAVTIFLQSLLQGKKAGSKLSELWGGVDWHRPLTITLLTLGFILLLELLGFILCGFLLMFILFRWGEKMSWGKSILIPLLTLSFTYFLFGFILKANLPRGIAGF